jgi:hypothetical protein
LIKVTRIWREQDARDPFEQEMVTGMRGEMRFQTAKNEKYREITPEPSADRRNVWYENLIDPVVHCVGSEIDFGCTILLKLT